MNRHICPQVLQLVRLELDDVQKVSGLLRLGLESCPVVKRPKYRGRI